MRVAVTGSTGLIGRALVERLASGGHQTVRVVRATGSSKPPGDSVIAWDPSQGKIDSAGLEGIDAVVHLAGEPIAARRWSDEQKQRIANSRTQGTELLAGALARLDQPPAVLVSASAIGYYGDRGDERLDEGSSAGSGFLAGIVLGVKQRDPSDMIYHTGGMSILIDGETAPNVIRGINMEDDFGFSWGFHLNQSRWIGSPYHKWGGRTDQDGVIYRFFGPDPIAFESSLSFRCGSRADDVETVAYYYHLPGTAAPPVRTPDRWLVTGFYDRGDDWETFNAAQEVERIPPDRWQRHFAGRRHFIRALPADRGWIDFRFSGVDPELTASHFADRAMYAAGYLDSERGGAATLRISFGDWLILWVNGERIAALRHDQGFETARIPVTLRKGRNELLLKTNNLGHPAQCWVANLVIEE